MTILFYPDPLGNKTKMYHLCKRFGIKCHNDPTKPHDLHIFWSYTRHSITPDHITLNAANVINRGCWDISKVKVNRIFGDLFIDPETYEGEAVQKLDQQGMHHEHSIVQCPTKRLDGYVYQRLVLNKVNDLYVRYRVYYAGGITHVLESLQNELFKTDIVATYEIPKDSIFKDENDLVTKCDQFGFHFGEIDVAMDGDNPIVLDVNNVPGGGFIENFTDTPFADDVLLKAYEWLKKMLQ